MNRTEQLVRLAAGDLITKIANDAGLLDRRVWCRTCGATQVVHNGLRDGWPTCCSSTMTLDPPEIATPAPGTAGEGGEG